MLMPIAILVQPLPMPMLPILMPRMHILFIHLAYACIYCSSILHMHAYIVYPSYICMHILFYPSCICYISLVAKARQPDFRCTLHVECVRSREIDACRHQRDTLHVVCVRSHAIDAYRHQRDTLHVVCVQSHAIDAYRHQRDTHILRMLSSTFCA